MTVNPILLHYELKIESLGLWTILTKGLMTNWL